MDSLSLAGLGHTNRVCEPEQFHHPAQLGIIDAFGLVALMLHPSLALAILRALDDRAEASERGRI